jgi:hypothetical protein
MLNDLCLLLEQSGITLSLDPSVGCRYQEAAVNRGGVLQNVGSQPEHEITQFVRFSPPLLGRAQQIV